MLTHLELQVGDDCAKVGIAHPLPISVDGTLDMNHPGSYRCQRVGNSATTIIMGVDAERCDELASYLPHNLLHFPWQGTAVGVAQHQHVRSACRSRPQRFQGIARVGFVTVEEMLAIIDHFSALGLDIRHTFDDHRQVLL